jgi:hypothetical protein
VDPTRGVLDHGEAVQPGEQIRLDVKKSAARIPSAWVLRNWAQVGSPRRGAGSNPAFFKIAHTVAGETFRPRPAICPAMRR